MSAREASKTKATKRTLAPMQRRDVVVRREGAVTVGPGALATAALALGAIAVGAMTIGKLAIGQFALGRTKPRSCDVDEFPIVRLIILIWS